MEPEYLSNPKAALLCAVQKIVTIFSDDIGNSATGNGSGFWLKTKRGNAYFVTNRHNVDPTMREDSHKSKAFASITIMQRAYNKKDCLPCGDAHPLAVSAKDLTIYKPDDNSDVVMLHSKIVFKPDNPDYMLLCLPEEATSYSRKPEMLDQMYFVGFPAKLRRTAKYDLPIARSCTIASFPEIDYSEEDNTIPSSKTCLVEGLSFGGSSGSAVLRINQERLELMGIMSGHFREGKSSEWHAGLSYLTMASSIQRIIKINAL